MSVMNRLWPTPPANGPVDGVVVVPGSKSEGNRALLLAALSERPSTVLGLSASRDTSLMADALRGLGAVIDGSHVSPPERFRGGADIDCGLAGTVMRFIPPVAMLADGPTRFHGDARASERPLTPLLSALQALGAGITADHLPLTLTPPAVWTHGPVTIDASQSSQFVSGLLLAGARFPHGLDLRHQGAALPSRPHIDMTIAMLAAHGVQVDEPEPDHWVVTPGALRAVDAVVDPDLTNAAAFLLAGVLTGGCASVEHWPLETTQPGALILGVIEQFGGWTRRDGEAMSAGSNGPLTACYVDLSAASELTPVVAALAAVAKGTSRLTGIGHIRGHETDRLVAIHDALAAVGVPSVVEDDGLAITGGGARHGGIVDSADDHRMVHLGALLGLVTPGVQVSRAEAVAKTMPDFIERWESLA
ncbi:MAG: 3-phosphoshikimate 1-carboxyvinyltransferase [Propionibacteriaceae bacterium]|nr:3-phosphoshikimate 1-carboxyvinyltransferase [Propionibacteriaceae bacterium]